MSFSIALPTTTFRIRRKCATVSSVLTFRIDASTEPRIGSGPKYKSPYKAEQALKDLRFILMVGDVGTRKNHLGCLQPGRRCD